jgi:hypothetical protein
MFQRTVRRICVLLTLTLGLALASPTRAAAAPRTGAADLWRWLENFWQERLVLLVRSEPPAPSRRGATPGVPVKNGGCNDPNGCAHPPAGGTTSDPGGEP